MLVSDAIQVWSWPFLLCSSSSCASLSRRSPSRTSRGALSTSSSTSGSSSSAWRCSSSQFQRDYRSLSRSLWRTPSGYVRFSIHLCLIYTHLYQYGILSVALWRNWYGVVLCFDSCSTPGLVTTARQVSHSPLPLSPSSINWYRRNLGAKQALHAMRCTSPCRWTCSFGWWMAIQNRISASSCGHLYSSGKALAFYLSVSL